MNKTIGVEEIYTLFECAEKFGLLFALAPFGNNINIEIPIKKSLGDKDIAYLSLSVRSYNGLRKIHIETVSQLVDLIHKEDGLNQIRNIGKKSVSEIKTKLLVSSYELLDDKEKLSFWMDFTRKNTMQKMEDAGGENNA